MTGPQPVAAPKPSVPQPAAKSSPPATSKPAAPANPSANATKAPATAPAETKPSPSGTNAPVTETKPPSQTADSPTHTTKSSAPTAKPDADPPSTGNTPGAKRTSGQEALAMQNKAQVQLQQQSEQLRVLQTQKQTTENLRNTTGGTRSIASPPEKSTSKSSDSSLTSATSGASSSDDGGGSVDPNTGARTRGGKSVTGMEDGTEEGNQDSSSGNGNPGNENKPQQNEQPKLDPKNGVPIAAVGDEGTAIALAELKAQRETQKQTSPNGKQVADTVPNPTEQPAEDKPAGPNPTEQSAQEKPIEENQTEAPPTELPPPDLNPADIQPSDAERMESATKLAKEYGIPTEGITDPGILEAIAATEIIRHATPDTKAPSGNDVRQTANAQIAFKAADFLSQEYADKTQILADMGTKYKVMPEAGVNQQLDIASVIGVKNSLIYTNDSALAEVNQAAVARLNGSTAEALEGMSAKEIAALNNEKSRAWLKEQGIEANTYAEMVKGYATVYNLPNPESATWNQVMEAWKTRNTGNPTVQANFQAADLSMNLTPKDYEKYFVTISGVEDYQVPIVPPALNPNGPPSPGGDEIFVPPLTGEEQPFAPPPKGDDAAPETNNAPPQGAGETQNTSAAVSQAEKVNRDIGSLLSGKTELNALFEAAANAAVPNAAIDAVLKEAGLTPEMDVEALRKEIIRRYQVVKDPDFSIFSPNLRTVNTSPSKANPFNGGFNLFG